MADQPDRKLVPEPERIAAQAELDAIRVELRNAGESFTQDALSRKLRVSQQAIGKALKGNLGPLVLEAILKYRGITKEELLVRHTALVTGGRGGVSSEELLRSGAMTGPLPSGAFRFNPAETERSINLLRRQADGVAERLAARGFDPVQAQRVTRSLCLDAEYVGRTDLDLFLAAEKTLHEEGHRPSRRAPEPEEPVDEAVYWYVHKLLTERIKAGRGTDQVTKDLGISKGELHVLLHERDRLTRQEAGAFAAYKVIGSFGTYAKLAAAALAWWRGKPKARTNGRKYALHQIAERPASSVMPANPAHKASA